jgi:hypothetical protein
VHVELLPSRTPSDLAHVDQALTQLMESRDEDRRRYTRIVSALLDLLGGQAVLPRHALDNAPGYQAGCTMSGDLVLQSVLVAGKKI